MNGSTYNNSNNNNHNQSSGAVASLAQSFGKSTDFSSNSMVIDTAAAPTLTLNDGDNSVSSVVTNEEETNRLLFYQEAKSSRLFQYIRCGISIVTKLKYE